jgi:aminoglycoside phosphotransferase family enzyme/predicted kinase
VDPVPFAAVHETHISVVLLLGDQAVKIKKPVRFPFVDLSTRELREQACHREVELNRRLAPDAYVGVADVVGPDGEVCDHVVLMRRMPDERRLATLAAASAPVDDGLSDLARLLAAFHAKADRSPEIDAAATRDAIAELWDAGFREMAPFVGSLVDADAEARIEARVRRYLAGREPLFAQRIAAGRAVDGHGDLLAGDVFLVDEGPQALDCLEFDDRLRYGDVLADVCFLAMDLERIGAPAAARHFLAEYQRFAGESHPASLEHHYVAYRAHVRAKVACLRGGDGAPGEVARLVHLADDHLARARVVLVLVGGGPGTGKSTVAVGIADARGWVVLRSDEVRKDLAGIGHDERATAAVDEGIYDAATTATTYRELLDRARTLLELGESVVLDATWGDEAQRAAARAVADATAADLVELRCVLPPEIAAARVAARERRGDDVSDATVEVARELAARADRWPSARDIDTAGPVAETIAAADRASADQLSR